MGGALVAVAACGGRDAPTGVGTSAALQASSPAATPATPAASAAGGMAHGDHSPHHGGLVMMKGDLHYEVVMDPAGHHRLYFSDATRADLPAATARSVTLTVHRTDRPDEVIPLQIDDTGESWEGSGRPVAKPADATVRVAFTIRSEAYWIDLPFVAPPPPAAATAK